MTEITYSNDVTGSLQKAQGSDGRLNVSSRSDDRSYYNSRDFGQAYSVPYQMQTPVAGEYFVYWKNTSTTRDLVLDEIEIGCVNAIRVKVWFVTGTAAAGTAVTPTNLNKNSNNDAEATAMEGAAAATGITGLSTDGLIGFYFVPAGNNLEINLHDRVRLGQGDAIALEFDEGTTEDVAGTLYGFYE